MNNELSKKIKLAQNVIDSNFDNGFNKLYSFTTENFNGYINNFDLNNKSLLTVGSSADQAINAILKGCKDITILDINPLVKYYFNLKKAGILTLSYEEFIDYFHDYDLNFTLFNTKTYQKLRNILSKLDSFSLLFWDILYKNNAPTTIHNILFENSAMEFETLKDLNLYLSNKTLFNTTKEMITNVNPKFINCNILNVDKRLNKRKYDNIFLSNINDYINDKDSELFQLAINYLMKKLNDHGKMMLAYIYNIDINWIPREFTNYDIEKIRGVKNICFGYGSEDAIITYQKTK